MKLVTLKMLSSLAFILSGFCWSTTSLAQERIPPETPEMETQREKMTMTDYNQDVRTRYQNIMKNVDRIQAQMVEDKINDPKFRKALSKFETRAKEFEAELKTADSVPAERQEKYRKKMRSELQKLHKEYNRLLDHWEKIKK